MIYTHSTLWVIPCAVWRYFSMNNCLWYRIKHLVAKKSTIHVIFMSSAAITLASGMVWQHKEWQIIHNMSYNMFKHCLFHRESLMFERKTRTYVTKTCLPNQCRNPDCNSSMTIFSVNFCTDKTIFMRQRHVHKDHKIAWNILCMHPANERKHDNVTSSLIGCVHTQ